jgi:hypothetical protein
MLQLILNHQEVAFVFLLLSLIAVSLFYIIFRKATDPGTIENLIGEKVSEERKRILSEINKKEEVKEDKGIEIEKKVADIIPKGNFKSAESFARKLLSNLASEMQMVMGIIYTVKNKNNSYTFLTGYALPSEQIPPDFKSGENLNGQAAASKEIMILRNLPENTLQLNRVSKSKPRNLIIAPL